MKSLLAENKIDYDGSQLSSHWIRRTFSITGDAIVSFAGKCDVRPEMIVDLEDREQNAKIFSREMLHFIVEHFKAGLKETIFCQRLLVAILKDVLEERVKGLKLHRAGDDIFEGDSKLTVSIATISPMSGLIHLGINIRSDGTPVKTRGLSDYDIDESVFANEIMEKYLMELASVDSSLCKVRWVK